MTDVNETETRMGHSMNNKPNKSSLKVMKTEPKTKSQEILEKTRTDLFNLFTMTTQEKSKDRAEP